MSDKSKADAMDLNNVSHEEKECLLREDDCISYYSTEENKNVHDVRTLVRTTEDAGKCDIITMSPSSELNSGWRIPI